MEQSLLSCRRAAQTPSQDIVSMKVLSLSLDLELAELRKDVISKAGHEVTSVTSEKDAVSEAGSDHSYQAVLVCHHFPAAAARQFIRLMRQNHPESRIVYVVHMYGEWPEVEADRYIAGPDGAKALLRVLDELGVASDPMTEIGAS
jgi:DNA-binding response OmpR family regulator